MRTKRRQRSLEFNRDHQFQPLVTGAANLARSQLPLGFARYDVYTFESYIPESNGDVVDTLKGMAKGSGHDNLYLWAGQGAGKSHLLQAVCNLAAQSELPCAYVPLKRVGEFTPDLLSSLEELCLVCLDDMDEIAGRSGWETACFDLFNRLRDTGTALVMSSRRSPKGSLIRLPDLKSRLSWGLCYHLQPLDDAMKIVALKQRARERGFELSDQVVEFLIKRVERDTHNLFHWLDRLDKHSLEAQRKLTVDFVKEILEMKGSE